MSQDIAETRICVQKLAPHDHQLLQDIHQSGNSPQQIQRLSAAFQTAKLWPKDSVITICFLESGANVRRTPTQTLVQKVGRGQLDPLQYLMDDMSVEDMVKKIIKERFEPLVNLKFQFVDNPSQAIARISFDPATGAWSAVGTDAALQRDGRATMNFGWFDVPTCIHEFGHLLGMIHEHQNPRGKKIQWNDKAVYAWAEATQGWDQNKTYTNIIQQTDINTLNGSDFDPESIMLYFFPASLTLNNTGTKQNLHMSETDISWIAQMYPKNNGISPGNFYKKIEGDNTKNKNSKFNWISLLVIVGGLLLVIIMMFLIWTR